MSDNLPRELHDKVTRGVAASEAEQAQLEQWYAQQDQEETAMFAPSSLPQSHTRLQAQIASVVTELATVTQHIQSLTADNEALRREIAVLHAQLARRPATQSA